MARWIPIVAIAGGSLTWAAAMPASADGGGAYLNFKRTNYLPGQVAVGRTSVAIPLGKRSVLDEGPFYAYLVTGSRWPAPGEALPNDALRIGTFTFHHRTGARFDLTTRLTIPDVRGDFYPVVLCNDPCSIDGFSQPVTGYLSIVQTRREARLLGKIRHRRARVGQLRHELRANTNELERTRSTLTAVERDDTLANAKVARLTDALAAERARRPLLDFPAMIASALALISAFLVVVVGRRRSTQANAPTELRTVALRERREERVG